MAEPTYTALRDYNRCIEGMLADPEVHGDLLLIGIHLARRCFTVAESEVAVADMCRDLFGDAQRHHLWRFRSAMEKDIRRYDHRAEPAEQRVALSRVRCGAPMIRRESLCGQADRMSFLATDVTTGRRYTVGACGRHLDWYNAERRRILAAVKELGDRLPVPAANAGGALVRHLPRVDWPAYWLKLDPKWTPPPEATPVAKPKLTLVITDDFDPADRPQPAPRHLALVTT